MLTLLTIVYNGEEAPVIESYDSIEEAIAAARDYIVAASEKHAEAWPKIKEELISKHRWEWFSPGEKVSKMKVSIKCQWR